MPKSTKIIVIERVKKVSELILDGYSTSDIIRYASDEKWNLSRRQVETYIAKATHLYESEVELDREKNFKKHIKRFEKLLKAAVRAGNLKVAMGIINSMAKLDGSLVDRKAIDISGNMGNQNISDEELDKLIQAEINKGKDGIPTQGQ